jgi:hypothetical protein
LMAAITASSVGWPLRCVATDCRNNRAPTPVAAWQGWPPALLPGDESSR